MFIIYYLLIKHNIYLFLNLFIKIKTSKKKRFFEIIRVGCCWSENKYHLEMSSFLYFILIYKNHDTKSTP